MDRDTVKERYAALPHLPDTGWDFTWIDRVRIWENFRDRGLDVSIGLRQLWRPPPTTARSAPSRRNGTISSWRRTP
jgi:hypothetical protein